MPKKLENEEKEVSFEENLTKLEDIVKKLESGEVPLDEAIDKFHEAMKISEICDKKLKNAEKEISKIVNKEGKLDDFEISE